MLINISNNIFRRDFLIFFFFKFQDRPPRSILEVESLIVQVYTQSQTLFTA